MIMDCRGARRAPYVALGVIAMWITCNLERQWGMMGLDAMEQVFQASALVMADLRVLKDVAFMGVAMTAEQWVPLLQVAQRDLLPWLQNKHLQGYRCTSIPPPASMRL